MLLVSDEIDFVSFGRCSIRGKESPEHFRFELPDDRLAARKLVRQHCPKSPGVYGMVDPSGALIYVGKSKSLRDRLLTYFQPEDDEAKACQIIARTRTLCWEPAEHEFIALLRELDLIRRYKPGFNVQGQPGRRRLSYVCIGRQPAPYVYVAGEPTRRSDQVFGPLRGTSRIQDAVRLLNDSLGLRDCADYVPMIFAEQLQMFGEERTARCLRYEMQSCLAPCTGACTSAEYAGAVRSARAFLRGSDQTLIERYEAEMKAAAAARQFERAASLRDAWENLVWLADQLERLRWFRGRHAFVYELETFDQGQQWYLFYGGRVQAIVEPPTNRRHARRAARHLERIYNSDCVQPSSAPREDLEAILLAATWFRRNPGELERTLLPGEAQKRCAAMCRPK
jgi:excinuclease ABC subunit C